MTEPYDAARAQARIDELETEVAALRDRIGPLPRRGLDRRDLLRGAGVAAVVGTGLALTATPASAAVGDGSVSRATGVDVPNAADTIYLRLTANGTPVLGDSTSEVEEGSIEVLSLRFQVATPSGRAGQASGRRTYQPVELRKRLDRATPFIWQALVQNQQVEAEFRFYASGERPQRTYTIWLSEARVSGIELVSPDGLSAAAGTAGTTTPFEDVAIRFNRVRQRDERSGVEFEDAASGGP